VPRPITITARRVQGRPKKADAAQAAGRDRLTVTLLLNLAQASEPDLRQRLEAAVARLRARQAVPRATVDIRRSSVPETRHRSDPRAACCAEGARPPLRPTSRRDP
jgi:hypothetical protein